MFVNVQVTFRHSTFQKVALKFWRDVPSSGPSAPFACGAAAMLTVAAVCSRGTEFQILRGEVTVLMDDCAEGSDTLKEKLVSGNKPWGRAC
jgi:hypothetical protein